MRTAVTGGAGFIGSSLVERLIHGGHEVVVLDDFSTGRKQNLEGVSAELVNIDLSNEDEPLEPHIQDTDIVYHLAANADVRNGMYTPRRDIQSGVIATQRLAEASKNVGVAKIVFSSTGAVYGDTTQHPTTEDAPFPIQTSLYGMSKVAAEGILSTYASHGCFQVIIHRFVSVLGVRYLHGHVIDFVRQLAQDPSKLRVLGDGSQRKSYMHVDDCVTGLMTLGGDDAISVYNLGSSDFCTVKDSVAWVCSELGVEPTVIYGTEQRGWVGDNPFTWLDVSRAAEQGWQTSVSIESSVRRTVAWLRENPEVLDRHDPRSR